MSFFFFIFSSEQGEPIDVHAPIYRVKVAISDGEDITESICVKRCRALQVLHNIRELCHDALPLCWRLKHHYRLERLTARFELIRDIYQKYNRLHVHHNMPPSNLKTPFTMNYVSYRQGQINCALIDVFQMLNIICPFVRTCVNFQKLDILVKISQKIFLVLQNTFVKGFYTNGKLVNE